MIDADQSKKDMKMYIVQSSESMPNKGEKSNDEEEIENKSTIHNQAAHQQQHQEIQINRDELSEEKFDNSFKSGLNSNPFSQI